MWRRDVKCSNLRQRRCSRALSVVLVDEEADELLAFEFGSSRDMTGTGVVGSHFVQGLDVNTLLWATVVHNLVPLGTLVFPQWLLGLLTGRGFYFNYNVGLKFFQLRCMTC